MECWRIDTFELWCWRTILMCPLDFKEIQLVNPQGYQSWIFIGKTDAEAEAPKLWPPNVNNWLTGKDPDGGKHWRREEKGTTEDDMVGWHHRLSGHEFEQAPGDSGRTGKPGMLQSMGSQRVRCNWATELNWITNWKSLKLPCWG